ncbi:hypothetical protein OYE22_25570 [Streptomyces sp. 71268]|uniref:hypothetical protein n=1 Tax=Streptomyces sp. 71268 TaxID=3002640 RepID=UPI0023F9EF04|nr:hypothetical protein [Streptomyces sp. 71268]WEV28167.1 hypothetical protein OYE22_25570 [Streptomyces sp. 71268]
MADDFHLYGSEELTPSALRDVVRESLGCSFEERESGFKGGIYYLRKEQGGGTISIEANWVDGDGYPAEPDFPEHRTLLYVTNPTQRDHDRLSQTSGLRLLRRTRVD